MKCCKTTPSFDAIQFDPLFEHKNTLPYGVIGFHPPGCDNWGYLGCTFKLIRCHTKTGRPVTVPILPGDWIITYENGNKEVCSDDRFWKEFHPLPEDPKPFPKGFIGDEPGCMFKLVKQLTPSFDKLEHT